MMQLHLYEGSGAVAPVEEGVREAEARVAPPRLPNYLDKDMQCPISWSTDQACPPGMCFIPGEGGLGGVWCSWLDCRQDYLELLRQQA